MTLLTFLVWNDPLRLAGALMMWCLVIFWVAIGGSIIFLSRKKFWNFYSKITWPFWIKFAVFATIFALIEEGVAVAITNLFYPTTQGEIMLTASTNYLEVVTKHSVVVLLPIFIIFGFVIKHFRLTPNKAFIVFGIIGVLAEMTIGGLFSLLMFSLWIFVYGLMVYLPSYSEYRN